MLWLVLVNIHAIPANADELLLPGSRQAIEESWKDHWRQVSEEKTPYLNRLVVSDSAYLRQHADNPIDWYPWQEAAFARAVNENKLIFLSIGYASCHWCHVMEAESFADVEVAALLNQSFVSIKVDREQHPDIDAYYNLVVETIKGESGWPITLILLPDLSPAFAANYLDKQALLTVLSRMGSYWQEQPDALKQNADLLAGEVDQRTRHRGQAKAPPDKSWADKARQHLLDDIDPDNGGFGTDNKFPNELKLQFLLNAYKQQKSIESKEILVSQLDAIMNGGLSDVVFGGIFRYTTDRQMSRPHFEKMLYNQALVVSLFSDAAYWLEKPDYASFAAAIIDFTKKWLRMDNGAYATAIDADHHGREGGYYLWPESVLKASPPGINQVSFGDDLRYLYGAPVSGEHEPWLTRLQQLRETPPRVIDNQVMAWNALWLSALLEAGEIDEAASLAETLWTGSWSNGHLHRLGGQQGFLDDYSYFSNALWQLYLQTEDSKWKGRARLLDREILELFYRDGKLSYRNRNMQGEFPVDLYQDRELPSPLAATLRSFSNHQAELEFIEAYEVLKAGANAVIGMRPEYYLSLVQLDFKNQVAPEQIMAKGHGMISLREDTAPGRWHVNINLDDDWHVNAAEVFDKNLVATQVSGEGVIKVHYPDGERMTAEFSDEPLNVYSDSVKIEVTMSVDQSHKELRVRLQACSSRVCLLPEIVHLVVPAGDRSAESVSDN
jgi:uncharacterized protein YyaL (SSP411 family)